VKRGIKLSINEGEVVGVSTEEDGNGPCVAGIKSCRHSDNYFCKAEGGGMYAFAMLKCPLDKWRIIDYTLDKTPAKKRPEEEGACSRCGEKIFWRLPTSDHLVCMTCSPPAVDNYIVVREGVEGNGG
jgi:hypothetical protein